MIRYLCLDPWWQGCNGEQVLDVARGRDAWTSGAGEVSLRVAQIGKTHPQNTHTTNEGLSNACDPNNPNHMDTMSVLVMNIQDLNTYCEKTNNKKPLILIN